MEAAAPTVSESGRTAPSDADLIGGGEMGALMRARDWSRTPLGAPSTWPQSLRTSINLMLEARFPMVVAWGPEFRFFYNDGYRQILGKTKHPGALGTPGAQIFPEIWSIVGPEFERVRRGESFAVEDWLLPLDRNGYLENCWFTLSYSPIRDESGGVGGLLAVVAETTGRVEGERRLATLRELARRTADAKSAREVCETAISILDADPLDVPFSIAYLVDEDGRRARLVSASHVEPGSRAAPDECELASLAGDGAGAWPLGRALVSHGPVIVDDLPIRFGELSGGPHPEPAHTAVLLPLTRSGGPAYGALIVGVSSRRALDDRYQAFFELASEHVVAGIANAVAYEEERRRAEALAELDRAKTTFFSNVSHEFRTPLTLMLGPLEELLGGARGAVPAQLRAELEAAHRNALRLLKLVNTLLDFARIESGRIRAVFEPVDLASLTRELASAFHSAADRAGLRLVIDCAEIPDAVYVDREMWEKIVLNVLANALKFTFEGEIAIRLYCREHEVVLEVRDTGVGIPEHELPRVFERFHRVQGARSRTHEGTGIGLALVQDLVRLHGGAIEARSTPGRGSTFTVTIPTGAAHLPADQIGGARSQTPTAIAAEVYVEEAERWLSPLASAPLAAEAGAAEPSRQAMRDVAVDDAHRSSAGDSDSRPHVLVVDDNADMREYLRRLLAESYDVVLATDGEDALASIAAQLPDLVLTDVMMPRMDGFALLEAIRRDERTRNVPVILVSARAGEESTIEGLGAGADDYLVKPFAARELLARVRTHLDLVRVRAEAYRHMQEANESKSQFLASMSHELRTPLNAILGYTDLLTLGVRGAITEAQRGDIERIRSASRYLLSLINDILNFVRVEAGHVDFRIAPVPATELLARAEEMVAKSLTEKQLSFAMETPVEPWVVRTDPERAQQILLNLLTNAVKFTDHGGCITLGCSSEGSHVRFHVRDTGCGIPAEQQSRIFEPFIQLDRTTARDLHTGIGLGLAISRDLAKRMEGDLTVRSEPGRGSEFTLVLPRL
jgi:signal transduction histidine kinase